MGHPKREHHDRQIIDERWVVVGSPVPGGMASVVEAFDLDGEFGKVALKLLPAATDDRWRRAGFEREQQALARLVHPNIVRLLATGRDQSTNERYLVFPWYPTRLQDHLRNAGALSWSAWWDGFGRPILTALELIHRQDVIHRDLKPANIMLDDAGTPVIIDFGIAKLERSLAPELTVGGESLPFTPPEAQTSPQHMSTRDVHAWGALTVFAVSGDEPYPEDNRADADVLAEAVEHARSRLPKGVVSTVARCLDVEPGVRPSTGGVLLADIEAALASEERERQARLGVEAPVVYLRLTRRAREGLESERDLFSAEVEGLVYEDLDGEHAVLPFRGEDDHYVIVGTELSLHVAVAEGGESLVVLNAATLPDSALERDRVRGWPGPVRFSTRLITELAAARDAVGHLRREVAVHAAERRTEDQRQLRARPLAVWRTLLSLLRSLEVAREDPLPYRAVRLTHQGIAFEMSRPPSHGLIGQQRLAPVDSGGDFAGEVVDVRSRELVVRTVFGNRHDVLASGQLRLDTRAASTAIERQQRSLDAVEYGRALRPDLATLLTDPASARPPRPLLGVRFSAGLDEPKQRATESALGSPDILLVQGPPGTGKTRFIREVVIQTLNREPDARILISSQAHAGLDNALIEVKDADPSIRLLRLARVDDERVDPAVSDVLLDRSLERWREDVVQQGNAWLRQWASGAGVVVSDIEGAMRLRELAAHLDRVGELTIPLAANETHLENLRIAARRASPSATASTTIREQEAELEELQEGVRVAERGGRDELARLIELEHLPKDARLRSLSSEELRAQATALLPADHDEAARCQQLIGLLADWHARFGAGPAFSAAALLRSQVVAATCVGLGGVRGAENVPFDLCIVDEASRATATELLIPLALSRRIVLVGDDRQLPPYVDEAIRNPEVLVQYRLSKDEVTSSLFRELARELPKENVVELSHQHRMNPAIGRLISECFYDGKLSSEPREPFTILGPLAPRPVTWLTTAHLGDRLEHREGSSIANDLEARVIRTFLNAANGLAAAAHTHLSVAVLAGYAAQRTTLERRLEAEFAAWPYLTIECQTVDSYQGRQADVVLYSMTRANPRGDIGFLREQPRLNVALSRARELLVIVGDHAFARDADRAQAIRRVLDHIEACPQDCRLERASVQ
jgi:AAA domain/Protein kinase domain